MGERTKPGQAASSAGDKVREHNRRLFESPFGVIYDSYMQRERVARVVAAVVWGSDVRPFYASMSAIGQVPSGATIVDAPCGSGVALRGLQPRQQVRYLGFDLSAQMRALAERRARRLGLHQVELAEGDAHALPLQTGSADLFLSYFGLHCFPHPAAAVEEAVRCLRPGGRLVGSMIVQGDRLLDRLRVRPNRGAYGPVGTSADLRRWLDDAGAQDASVGRSGVFALFSARKPREDQPKVVSQR